MKKLFLFISLSWATLSACTQSEILLPQAQQTSIYEEQISHPSGGEDRCYLIFWKDSLGVHGCLNATTDEFYLAREGYLPGYEIRPLQNIIVKQDSLSFTVEAGVELVIDEGEPFSIPRKRVFIRCN